MPLKAAVRNERLESPALRRDPTSVLHLRLLPAAGRALHLNANSNRHIDQQLMGRVVNGVIVWLCKDAIDGAAHGGVRLEEIGAVDHLAVAPAGRLGGRNKVWRVKGGGGDITRVPGWVCGLVSH